MNLVFDVNKYIEKIKKSDNCFHTFINNENLSAGVLVLKPGEEDIQEPHDNDEVYFIIKGNGFLKIKNKDYGISENKMYFVEKNVPHFFHGNSKKLIVLYFFSGFDS
jgi:mannose-6-phosphate isomerase-like protein (cupin superfamily)